MKNYAVRNIPDEQYKKLRIKAAHAEGSINTEILKAIGSHINPLVLDLYCINCGYHTDGSDIKNGSKHTWVSYNTSFDIPDYMTENDCDN